MTIRQQGGVFGRNPKFNDIEANTVNAGSATVDSISMDGSIIQIDANNAGQTSALNRILFKDTDTSTEIGQPLGQIDFWNNDSQNGVAARIQGISEWTSGISGIAMYTGSGGSPALAETMRLTWDGQVKATRGNFVVESGYGLSFAATSGTGTSELFDDYEEGTWTPEYVPLSGSFTTLTYSQRLGYYTKIGRFVFVTGYIYTSEVDATGAASVLTIQGLPFTPQAGVAAGTASVGDARSWNLSTGIETPRLYFNSGRIEMSKHAANSAFASVVPADMLSGANAFANGLNFSGCYITG